MIDKNLQLQFYVAEEKDCSSLTTLTKSSKAYWGYSHELMILWEQELTITADYITNNTVIKAHLNGLLIGYYSFVENIDNVIELDNLFISPNYIGKGFGRQLMNSFMNHAVTSDALKVILYSEPKAQKFYEKFGFMVIGQQQSAISNRTLPIMERTMNKKQTQP